MQRVLITFLIYGIIGWLWETPYESIRQKRLVNRGFLYGPFIPIYGAACVIIMGSLNLLNLYIEKTTLWSVLGAIIFTAVIASVLEYVTSYVMEVLFKTRWWDYSDMRFNLNGRIALISSAFWGIGGYVFWRFIHVPLMEAVYRLPQRIILIGLSVGYTLFVIDFIITLRQLITLAIILEKLNLIYNELSGKVAFSIEVIQGGFIDRKEKLKQSLTERKQVINEQILLLTTKRGITLSARQRGLLDKFNSLLEKGKGFGRFYYNYPKAYSRRFKKLLRIIRYKRDTEQ